MIVDAVTWVNPWLCVPPHRVSHPDKLDELSCAFSAAGWHRDRPALVGYRCNMVVIQLLSGSHRWHASIGAGLAKIPVVLRTWEECYSAFGSLSRWRRLMAAPAAGREASKASARSAPKDSAEEPR